MIKTRPLPAAYEWSSRLIYYRNPGPLGQDALHSEN